MFNEHGEFKVTIQGDILLAVVSGAWNLETAKAYRETMLKTIESANGNFLCLISNVNAWELCTPDCQLLMGQLAKECIAKGLKREAVVNENIESVKMDLFRKHTIKNTTKTSLDAFQRSFFETDTEAREWQKKQGVA